MSNSGKHPNGLTRRQAIALGTGAALATSFPLKRALAADKVIFRTNWLFYGSHAVFFLGIDKGLFGGIRRRLAPAASTLIGKN